MTRYERLVDQIERLESKLKELKQRKEELEEKERTRRSTCKPGCTRLDHYITDPNLS